MAVVGGARVRATVTAVFDSASTMQNVFQLRNVGTDVSDAEAIDDVVEVLEALYQLLAAVLSTLYVVRDVRVVNDSSGSDVGLGLFTDTTPGTSVNATEVPQAACGVILTTTELGVTGRKYFGAIDSGNINSLGLIDATLLADLADVADYMTSVQVATNTTWEFGVNSVAALTWLPFESYVIPLYAWTQRRRRVGVGI